jgi:hypothetical protein
MTPHWVSHTPLSNLFFPDIFHYQFYPVKDGWHGELQHRSDLLCCPGWLGGLVPRQVDKHGSAIAQAASRVFAPSQASRAIDTSGAFERHCLALPVQWWVG